MSKIDSKMRWAGALLCLILIVAHALFPSILIDTNTIILLLIILLLWLFPYIESINFPGGGGIKLLQREVNRLEEQKEVENLLKPPTAPEIPPQEKVITGIVSEDPLVFTAEDPNLVLAALRIDMEKKIRELASVSKIPDAGRTVYSLINSLVNKRRLPHSEARYIEGILQVCNKAVHGIAVDAFSAARVVRLGKDVIKWLNSLIEIITIVDYTFEYE